MLLAPSAGVPRDSDGNPVAFARERIEGLIDDFARERAKIIIPTPALSEALVRADVSAAARYVAMLRQSRHFIICAFDERAALEVALWTRQALDDGDKKEGSCDAWAKVKYDRQIAAIARVNGASVLYTNDGNLRNFVARRGMKVVGIEELPIPPAYAQLGMFDDPE